MNISECVEVNCPNNNCGIPYHIPKWLDEHAARLGKERTIWCPNGHTWTYTRSEAEKLRDQVKSLEAGLESKGKLADSYWARYEQEKKTGIYWKGIAHRVKKS